MRLELRLEQNAGPSLIGRPGVLAGQLAVAVGFEPTDACTSHAFEACSFGRSDTLPPTTLAEGPGAPRRQVPRHDQPDVHQAAVDAHFQAPHMPVWRAAGAELGVFDRQLSLYEIASERAL